MCYSAIAVANAFIDIAADNGFYLTNLKLQKLVYFAHGWYLAFADAPLITDEIQSWRYGPVIHNLYSALRHYGSRPINKKNTFRSGCPSRWRRLEVYRGGLS